MEKIFYIAQLLGAVNDLAFVGLFLALIVFLCLLFWYFTEDLYEPSQYNITDAEVCKKWFRKTIVATVISALVLIFVPSKKTYLFMAGGNALEELAKNEKVQQRASKTIDLLEKYMEAKVDGNASDNNEQ